MSALMEEQRVLAEREMHVEMLSGTEVMTDVGRGHLVHAKNSPNATVLIPQPTASPNDPLV
jgi:hypothetical protein